MQRWEVGGGGWGLGMGEGGVRGEVMEVRMSEGGVEVGTCEKFSTLLFSHLPSGTVRLVSGTRAAD